MVLGVLSLEILSTWEPGRGVKLRGKSDGVWLEGMSDEVRLRGKDIGYFIEGLMINIINRVESISLASAKISALSSASLPLSGSEIVPVVQAGINSQVSITNILSSTNMTFNSVAAIAAATIPGNVSNISALSIAAPGDLHGDAMYFNRALVDYSIFKGFFDQPAGWVGLQGYEFRNVIQLAGIIEPWAASTYYLRVTLAVTAGTSAGVLDNAFAGYSDAATEQDFNETLGQNQIPITFNTGATSVTGINGETLIVSDLIPFVLRSWQQDRNFAPLERNKRKYCLADSL